MPPYYRQPTYTIKVFHPQKAEARILKHVSLFDGKNFDELVKNIRVLFEIDESQKFSLTYRDSTGDEISFRDNSDFYAAIRESNVPRISIRFENTEEKKDEESSTDKSTSDIDEISSVFSESLQSIMKQLELGITTLQASVEKSTTQTVDAVVKTAAETAANVYRSMLPAPTLSDKPQFDIICDGCYTPIRGQRWRCETCDDFDLCSACKSRVNHNPEHNFRFITPPSAPQQPQLQPQQHQSSVSLSMNSHHAVVVREELSQSESSQSIFICDYCDNDIVGIRHSCAVCPDFDLCHSCFSIVKENHPEHIFVTRLVATQASKKPKVYNDELKKQTLSPRPSHDVQHTPTHIHQGVDCDNCEREISGTRYKCGHCPNFDLCEACEEYAPDLHDETHAFIKIRYPIQSLAKKPILPRFSPLTIVKQDLDIIKQNLEMINYTANDSSVNSSINSSINSSEISSNDSNSGEALESAKSVSTTPASIIDIPNSPFMNDETKNLSATRTMTESKPEATLSASFVSDLNIPDGALVVPNKSFIKMWKVVNDGNVDWPVGTHLLFNGGSILRPYPVTNPNTFMVPVTSPNEEACVSAELQAPDCPGEYSSYFCLCTPDGVRFGDSLWCTIRVDLDEEPDNRHRTVHTTSGSSSTSMTTSAADIMMNSSNSMIYPTILTASSSIHENGQQQDDLHGEDLSHDDGYTDHDAYSEFTNDHISTLTTSEAATTHTYSDSHMSSPTSSELDIGERHREDLFFTEEDEENSLHHEQPAQLYHVISPSATTLLDVNNDTNPTTNAIVTNDEDDFVIVDEQGDELKKEDEILSNESNSLSSSVQTITNAEVASPISNNQQITHDTTNYRSQLLQLHEMGFTSYDDLAISLLHLHEGRVQDVIAKLLHYP